MKYTKFIANFLYLFFTTFIISGPAFFNNYPLIYYDSNNYISISQTLVNLSTNPIGYPLFIRAFSWQFTMWPVIIAQSFLVNLLIFFIIRSLFTNSTIYKLHFSIILILSLTTGMSWVSSFIMADIFVPIGILALYLFYSNNTDKFIKYFALICIAFSSIVHFIIPLILLTTILLFVAYKFVSSRAVFKLIYKQSILLVFVILISVFFNRNYNKMIGKEKTPSLSQIILVARLMEVGILDEFLEKHCENNRYCLCELKGKFPNSPSEFVWTENGPFSKTGGWIWSKEEYDEIIYRIFTNPYYVSEFIYKSFISAIKQLYTFYIKFETINNNSTIKKTMAEKFQQENKEFNRSLQVSQYDWYSKTLNIVYYVIVTLSLLILVLNLKKWRSKENSNRGMFLFITICGILINAAISGSISNVIPRYQARVNWLIPLIALLMIYQEFSVFKGKFHLMISKPDDTKIN